MASIPDTVIPVQCKPAEKENRVLFLDFTYNFLGRRGTLTRMLLLSVVTVLVRQVY
jgi:hypothetical protein